MRKHFFTLLFLFLLLAATIASVRAEAVSSSSGNGASEIPDAESAKPNGEYVIHAWKDGVWKDCDKIKCSEFFMEKSVTIKDLASTGGFVTLKIAERGGGIAHLDSVKYCGRPPYMVNGKRDPYFLRKLSKKDFDVIDAYKKSFEVTFDVRGADGGGRLTLSGRIEKERITKEPFRFPLSNLYKKIGADSSFYTYRLKARDSFAIDGSLSEVSKDKPLFREFSLAGTGHPSGYTYGWVKDDGKNLYVAIDFTVDNTMDGDKDYAKVHVKTGKCVREFKVSVPQRKWGKTFFTYTDKVSYQHKVYEFLIPLNALDVKDNKIALAFSTYGTGAPPPGLSYMAQNNRFLGVYERFEGGSYNVLGRLIDNAGSPLGNEIAICTDPNTQNNSSVAYDSANRRFLVVWADFRNGTDYNIYGQRLNADGTLEGSNFTICTASNIQIVPSVAYDSANRRFLAVWGDYRNGTDYNIYGQRVNADGTLEGAEIAISTATNQQLWPSLAYDSANRRFLAVWADFRSGTDNDIYGQLVNADGTLEGANIAINTALDGQIDPSVAYDSANTRFLAVWSDNRNGTDYNIYGQRVNANGTLEGSDIAICTASTQEYNPSVAYDGAKRQFLPVWQDNRGVNAEIYGQRVNANGTLDGGNFVVYSGPNNCYEPTIAFNTLFANFLVAFWDDATGWNEPGYALLGSAAPGNTAISPESLNFGNVTVANSSQPQTVTVSNNGAGGIITMGNLSITGDNASLFALQNDGSSGQEILQGEQRTVQVIFTPDTPGEKLATLSIPSNDPETPTLQIPLSGTGVDASSGNNSPTTPSLVEPGDGQQVSSTIVTFKWKKCTDQDGDTVNYHLYLGKKPDLSDATITDVNGYVGNAPVIYAGASLLFAVLFLALRRRKGALLLLAVAIISSMIIVSCSGNADTSRPGSTGTAGSDDSIIQHTLTNLDAKTTCYWKVVSDDGRGGTASSAIWSLRTP